MASSGQDQIIIPQSAKLLADLPNTVIGISGSIIDPGGGNLFCWSDDFSEAIINTTRWAEVNNNSASSTIVAGILVQNTVGATGNETTSIVNQFANALVITSETWLTSVDLSNIALPPVTSELIALLRVLQTTNDLEFGYVRDNGTNQQLAVRVNGTDEVLEDDNSTSATLTIERGDFTFSDFGGSVSYPDQKSTVADQGVFKARYYYETNRDQGTSSISGDILTQSLPERTGSATKNQWNTSLLNLSGDCDIEFEVDWTGMDVALATNETYAQFSFALYLNSVTASSAAVVIGKWGPGALYYPNQTAFDFQGTLDGGTDGNGSDVTPGTTDKIRIVRDSGAETIKGYFNSTAWDFDYDSSDGYFRLGLSQYGNSGTIPACNVKITKLKVLDGTGAEVTEKRVLFYKGTDLKYAYDDSGENVVSASIELDSVGTQAYTQEYDNFIIQSPKGTNYCT